MGVVGPNTLLTPNGPESVCRILSRGDKGLSICSGALISSNKILSAAHCIRPDHTITTVECGYQGFDASNLQSELSITGSTIYTKGVVFKESANAIAYAVNEETDQSLITLDRELSLQPMKVATELHGENAICYFSGYGFDNNATAGRLNTGKIQGITANGEEIVTETLVMSTFFQRKINLKTMKISEP